MKTVKLLIDGGVANIVLNRPEVGNAFNREMLEELLKVSLEINSRDDIKVAVIYGEGKHFCAGGDLNWMIKMGKSRYSENFKDAEILYKAYESLESLRIPLIAKVRGAVRGGGMGIVCISDIVIAEKNSNFAFSEVKIGLVPSVVSSFALMRLNYSVAKRLFLTAEVFGADFAKDIGLVDEVADDANDLENKSGKFIKIILSNNPEALKKTKSLMRIYRKFVSESIKNLTIHLLATTRMEEETQKLIEEFLKNL